MKVVHLKMTGDEPRNWSEFGQAHGYHISPRVTLREPWFADANLFARSPNLLAVCSTGAGYDIIDVDAATAAGIIVCNQAGANKEGVAEHALGFMLALSKKIVLADHLLRRVADLDRSSVQGNDIRGKTLGIVGLGHIGGRLAELCRGLFEMPILAFDPYLTAQQIAARGATKVDFDELLDKSDFVSINCPLTKETKGMMGKTQFAQMKRTAYFITTARGGIHDEGALANALAEKQIAGAGLDVFLHEPPAPDHPLLAFDNVVASPHTAGITSEAVRDVTIAAAEQWISIFEGKAPPRLLNPEVWPRYCERFEKVLGFRPASLA